MPNISFTIHLPPVTKKNHSQIIKCKGRSILIPSKQYLQYEKDCSIFMPHGEPIDYKINLKCVYYMPTKRKVDLCNLLAATCDILVKHKVIADDNSEIVVSHDGSRVLYDKLNPRTAIEIERIKE